MVNPSAKGGVLMPSRSAFRVDEQRAMDCLHFRKSRLVWANLLCTSAALIELGMPYAAIPNED